MKNLVNLSIRPSLEAQGLYNLGDIRWNLSTAQLVEEIIRNKEGWLSHHGAIVVHTGKHTGRAPRDKFIVAYPDHDDIWWGPINSPISPEYFARLHQKFATFFQLRPIYVQDVWIGNHPAYRLPVRIITEKAWHSLFARNLFIREEQTTGPHSNPEFTLIHAPSFRANPVEDGTRSETVIAIDFVRRLVLIGGTAYAGEIKKAMFTVMNYLLPQHHVLPMHCSANVGPQGDVALFFGLSGTGKTTLSSDPERPLIGDDEHGWGEDGIFNFEGGCYAKTIRLNAQLEPLIWSAVHRFGTVLENVILNPDSRLVDFESDTITENTRAAYPLEFIPHALKEGRGGHPQHIFFLSADAFGVLPPLARLTPEQALFFFLTGYTAKLAGTETGLGREPQATFSACFGAPFLPLHPTVYGRMLKEKIQQHGTQVWLINTGWTGGPYGVGTRIPLPYTRAMVHAVLSHGLDSVPYHQDPIFGLWVPETCPGVPRELLQPRQTWSDPQAYDQQARTLAEQFRANFEAITETSLTVALNHREG
ncbi:phosphoenolpyruvate carboxykinase (ATP) [Thermanaerothrix daxensis]|uniref:phosphoenolpyruvate carboxykinase (ATP) n=1 Tax=Thermanaerothrix daxensis TaxID=869279 RepID=UPI000AB55FE9|nr:phosphoenolpyruvate carboxykinase (ATP) [Thermanaerothrix daxensis]